ncbi:MAG: 5-formyltetrahydrofolate cyclo-ligase [Oscillospiraceae bacterium]|nr:5-formyltetrahydrofolate cyclo-ligase [Oscillospiraceae bacterium]
MTEKTVIRTRMRKLRKEISPEIRAENCRKICTNLFSLPVWQTAESIYLYLSLPDEIDTSEIWKEAVRSGKRVAAPKVHGKTMDFFWLDPETGLETGAFGISEPVGAEPALDPSALILVPGLAFSQDGNRCGYGGGYYDRYLSLHPGHTTIGLCYAFQIIPDCFPSPHDLPVDFIITESGILNCRT